MEEVIGLRKPESSSPSENPKLNVPEDIFSDLLVRSNVEVGDINELVKAVIKNPEIEKELINFVKLYCGTVEIDWKEVNITVVYDELDKKVLATHISSVDSLIQEKNFWKMVKTIYLIEFIENLGILRRFLKN